MSTKKWCVTRHKQSMHDDNAPRFQCPHCQKMLKRKDTLKSHMNRCFPNSGQGSSANVTVASD